MESLKNIKGREIVSCLLEEKYITQDQLDHALRINSKLALPKTVLTILKELGHITDKKIKEALRKNKTSLKVGDLLVELEYLSRDKLEAALTLQKAQQGKKLGEILIESGFLSETSFLELLSVQMGFIHLEPDLMGIDQGLAANLPLKWCQKYRFLPVKKQGDQKVVVFADPLNQEDVKAAMDVFGADIIIGVASLRSILSVLDRLEKGIERDNRIDESSAQGIVDSVIMAAIRGDASDIHMEPLRDRLHVRFRTDGILLHYKDYPLAMIPMVTSRLKIMSNADITEKRRHQGGRISFDFSGITFDLRVSFFVTIHGEKIVMRILNKMNQIIDIRDVGMQPRVLKRFLRDALEVPSGVLIVTGPTGSGKTTTVYSCINHIKNPQISIVTAEEPVEFLMDGIAQCSINPAIDMTYEETLRHVVRQDPDVIVIGEIRDKYSAEVAVQASLTGHKVLTTFHTEDSINGLIRLMNMDIEVFLISSTVVCVLAQRLLRKVCSHCGKPVKPTSQELQALGYTPADVASYQFRRGDGCLECHHTGYKGRVAVIEMLILNEHVRDAMVAGKSSYDIRKISIQTSGLVTLFEDAVFKAAKGITTLDEVFRCVPRQLDPRPLSEIKRLQGA